MATKESTHVHLTIDEKTVEVPKGTTVYQAAERLGIDIPIFCYHDRMPPFGACRMCLVEVDKMLKLQASCTLEATDGMVVKTNSKKAEEGRKGIVELLLINHPLDCPICDRGGECPLQENALHHGPGESRFFEEKRRFKKPIPLGPVLMLDRERCIVCARCTRFGEIIAGDHALEFIQRGYKTEVGTPDGRPAESKFIGNTIMICPVGALTSQVYRFRARPWDNDSAQSSCTLCPVGCSLILDSRDGEVMRTRSSPNWPVNDIWLCDKGWFGYEHTQDKGRLTSPLIRKNGKLEPAGWDEAIALISRKIVQAKPRGKLAGIGGNPLTTEENYLFQKLIREGASSPHVDHRVGMPLFSVEEEGRAPGMECSFGECEKLTVGALFGVDVTEEFPVLWLRLKQAINHGAKIFFFGHYAPEIAPHLAGTFLHPPGDELEILTEHLPNIAKLGGNAALFVGRQYLANHSRKAIFEELKAFAKTQEGIKIHVMEGRGNSFGARLAGMHPEAGPAGRAPLKPGMNALEILETAAKSGWDFLYTAGADPATKYPTKLWKEARRNLGFLVVQDLFLTETANDADVVLPTLSAFEKKGHIHNLEGRRQRLNPGKEKPEGVRSDSEIFCSLLEKLNISSSIDHEFSYVLQQDRLELQPPTTEQESPSPRERRGNENALLASFAPSLFDQGARMERNPHLLGLAKEPKIRIHPGDGQSKGLEDGKKVRLQMNGEEIAAKVKFDPGVAPGTVVLPLGFKKIPVNDLGGNLLCGDRIELGDPSYARNGA